MENLSTIVYLINRLPTLIINYDSPYLRLFVVTPNISLFILLVVFVLSIFLPLNVTNLLPSMLMVHLIAKILEEFQKICTFYQERGVVGVCKKYLKFWSVFK